MKKALLPVVTILSLSSLIGCSSSSKERLTFGTLYHTTSVEINNDTAYSKKENENFLLATYGDVTCGCWTYFSRVLDVLSKNNNLLTYKLSDKEIDDRLNAFGIKNSDNPAFYIIANGKIVKRYFYADDDGLFNDEKKLYKEITDNINLPYMYYINDEQIAKEDGIYYYLRATCPDCSYCTPHVLMPYLKDKKLSNKIYVYDLDPLRIEDQEKYQAFKDEHFLSNKNNAELGYDTGYVPTFQYYKEGKLVDMAVYFNDCIVDGKIASSYYDEERVKHLQYTKNVLTGTSITEEDLADNHWKSAEAQNKYYEPYLKAFLDYYLR